MMSEDEYAVRLLDLPTSVEAFVTYDCEDFPSIYVNSRLTRERQCEALRHELRHIERDDMYSSADIRDVEKRN